MRLGCLPFGNAFRLQVTVRSHAKRRGDEQGSSSTSLSPARISFDIAPYGYLLSCSFPSELLRACFLLQHKVVCGEMLRKQANGLHPIMPFGLSEYTSMRTIRNHTLD